MVFSKSFSIHHKQITLEVTPIRRGKEVKLNFKIPTNVKPWDGWEFIPQIISYNDFIVLISKLIYPEIPSYVIEKYISIATIKKAPITITSTGISINISHYSFIQYCSTSNKFAVGTKNAFVIDLLNDYPIKMNQQVSTISLFEDVPFQVIDKILSLM